MNGKYPRVHFGEKAFKIEGLGGSKCGGKWSEIFIEISVSN